LQAWQIWPTHTGYHSSSAHCPAQFL
jgi:hypothetical protein